MHYGGSLAKGTKSKVAELPRSVFAGIGFAIIAGFLEDAVTALCEEAFSGFDKGV